MNTEVLIALLVKKVEERLAALPDSSPLRGPRGQRGSPGKDGKDFDIAEHADTIRAWAKEFALKFDDLTDEQRDLIRGARGRDGRDGKDGKNFDVSENMELFKELAAQSAIKFSDLTPEQKEEIRGHRGKDGRDGKDFSFDENKDSIESIIRDYVSSISESLKLKFSDLSEENINDLRGPRGPPLS